ncbi:hypothetical protein LEP1GSC128_0820 [Leptospira borgpetersenii str. 200801926]|uniref:Uncharacterized protein n=1 Tax=Leptospira borgpetersenii str. 200801926 TaxID=1193009 RepID=A0ABP2S8N3_LEPBO|nr:hypothetical protein [Leptospira borgpetersenii]EKP15461.1 hypothetical protein LEP1GSC128_0820 [Leptospira borgpetersenii str. 200801926]EMN13073.1 hypothetical protein LEP1GSC055_2009 [Leptospira borgpetersenii str. Brem 307]
MGLNEIEYLEPVSKPEKNIYKRSGKFLKNVRVPTETVVLKVFPVV